MEKKSHHLIRKIVIGFMLLVLFILGILVLINLNLPTHSPVVDRLAPIQKARLTEAFHLRRTLGDSVWPGWGQADIPVITYNEKYAFLVGFPNPPEGWLKMPQRTRHGGPWQPVPGDTFAGQAYYRQMLPDADITPEAFTVLVGERWVASIQTKEYAKIYFCAMFRKQLPPWLRPFFPYTVLWHQLLGETDNYIAAIEHESFHSFQGLETPSRLAEGENVTRFEGRYPWDDAALDQAWRREMNILVQAVRAKSAGLAIAATRRFLAERDNRRKSAGLDADLIHYEREREWLEGLAKYAEVAIGRLAEETSAYQAEPSLLTDPDFKNYSTRERYWSRNLAEARRTAGQRSGIRFYNSGMAQAALLDRLRPNWKKQVFNPGVALEDLLRESVH